MENDSIHDDLTKAFDNLTSSDVPEAAAPEAPEVDEWIEAPKSFKPEYHEGFKALPLEMRKYIHQRESETEKGFKDFGEKLKGYQWIDEVYGKNKERLGGLSLKEWVEDMAAVDGCLAANPAATIKALSDYYKISQNNQDQGQPQVSPVEQKIAALEQRFSQYMTQRENERVQSEFDTFINEKDEAGNLKHPYFNEVKNEMSALFGGGLVKNFAEAYDKAVRLNPDVWEKLNAERIRSEMEKKAAEAEKSKNAAFDPQSKATPANDPSDDSVRGDLERVMEQMGI